MSSAFSLGNPGWKSNFLVSLKIFKIMILRKKMVKLWQVWNCNKTTIIINFTQKFFSLPFDRWYMIFTWYLFSIYIIYFINWVWIWYFHVISNVHVQRSKFGAKCDWIGGNSEKNLTHKDSWGMLFPPSVSIEQWK